MTSPEEAAETAKVLNRALVESGIGGSASVDADNNIRLELTTDQIRALETFLALNPKQS